MAIETIEEFYKNKFDWLPGDLQQNIGHFNVFRIEDHVGPHAKPVNYSRRSFYKISLLYGDNIIHYADKSIRLSGATLVFVNPMVAYKFEHITEDRRGFFCIFTEAFFSEKLKRRLSDLPMFALTAKPVYDLSDEQGEHVSTFFVKMLNEINSDYAFKYDLIRNYVSELIHYALKTQPSQNLYRHADARSRITSVFTELLERQFPIESPSQRFVLRSASDFAHRLSVHVNHLNRAIRQTTGKTTTDHIAERLLSEAKSLLKYTDWNIAEIGYSLGFDEPAHFNNFFKKQTKLTPSGYRNV